VATIRALKMHGGVAGADLATPDPDAVERGIANLARHVENIRKFGLPAVVGINSFPTDTDDERRVVLDWAARAGVPAAVADIWARGGGDSGGDELAAAVLYAIETPSEFQPL